MRKAPTDNAKEFSLGYKKRGNDGNMWKIIKTTKGVKRWKKVLASRRSRKNRRRTHRNKTARGKRKRRIVHRSRSRATTTSPHWQERVDLSPKKGSIYFTHDNGGRPFKVVISGKKVSVYEQPNWKDWQSETGKEYTKLIKAFPKVKKIFIGKDTQLGSDFDGNSILLQLTSNKYVFIGGWIHEFVTPDDTIIAYYSKVGNSDVPYPVALGDKNAYFMLDLWEKGVVPRDVFPPNTDWEDAYMLFYGHKGDEALVDYGKKFDKVKVIQKAHW